MIDPALVSVPAGRRDLTGAPEGADALAVAELARAQGGREVLFVARDDARMARMAETLAFFAADIEIIEFPAWDCVPYDRVSPHVEVVARRIDALSRLARAAADGARVVLTSVAALMQRVPPRQVLAGASFATRSGDRLDLAGVVGFLNRNGYGRTDTVMEPGEYAVRGGILDLFPPGTPEPVRLDFFGDELESIRSFDPLSQRTTGTLQGFSLAPVSEVTLDEAAIARFRSAYREMFGVVSGPDPLYESVSQGLKFNGMEHWLPLFHDGMDTLFAYVPEAVAVLDPQVEAARDARHALILEYYEARRTISRAGLAESGMVYHPLPPPRVRCRRYLPAR